MGEEKLYYERNQQQIKCQAEKLASRLCHHIKTKRNEEELLQKMATQEYLKLGGAKEYMTYLKKGWVYRTSTYAFHINARKHLRRFSRLLHLAGFDEEDEQIKKFATLEKRFEYPPKKEWDEELKLRFMEREITIKLENIDKRIEEITKKFRL
jgi:hypothetical protein|tara:strand:+ start:466 stop:924 length:459 start_codon:yes stop_codon:yes gene_type:complete